MRNSLHVRSVGLIGLCTILFVCAISWGREAVAGGPRRNQINTGETCLNCHRVEEGFSHPIGVLPSMAIPRDLPLVNGRIGCATCHEGGSGADHTRAKLVGSSMLRDNAVESLCSRCHLSGGSQSWHTTQGRAHLRWQGRNSFKAELVGGLDKETRSCLSCHDGTIASDVVPGAAGIGIGEAEHARGHPIGTPMKRVTSEVRQGMGGFTSHNALDSRVRLFQGTVGCGSCHSPYSSEENGLVMSNVGSKLCLSCHQM